MVFEQKERLTDGAYKRICDRLNDAMLAATAERNGGLMKVDFRYQRLVEHHYFDEDGTIVIDTKVLNMRQKAILRCDDRMPGEMRELLLCGRCRSHWATNSHFPIIHEEDDGLLTMVVSMTPVD